MPRLHRLICVTAGSLAIFASGCNLGLPLVQRQPQPASSGPVLPSHLATPTLPLPPPANYDAEQIAMESIEHNRAIDAKRSRNADCAFG